MGINKYGDMGAIESGHATFAGGVHLTTIDDGFGGMGRGDFVPWTIRHNTEWLEVEYGAPAREMIERNPDLRSTVVAKNLATVMPWHDMADEHEILVLERTDFVEPPRVLGVKKSNGLIQKTDVGDMIDTFVEAAKLAGFHEAGVITAFEMDRGKRFVVCANLGSAEWFGGALNGLVSGMTSWDGTWKSKVIESVCVSQCTNTVSMNLFASVQRNKARGRGGEEQIVAFKNTKGVADRWALAQQIVTAAAGKWTFFRENALNLVETPITDATFRKLVEQVLGERPKPRKEGAKGKDPQDVWDAKFSAITSEWKADHNEYAHGTAWGAVMAANGFDLWLDGGRDLLKNQIDGLYEGSSKITDDMLLAVMETAGLELVAA